jgi:hypothetical protein
MSFTGHENHAISLQEASAMTKRFRDNQTSATYIKAEYFGRDAIEAILNQENCVGIRAYYAIDENMVNKLVLVGVDASENDLFNGVLAEKGFVCPPTCSTNASPLNA